MNNVASNNLGKILERGEAYYNENLKQELETAHFGEYAVIDVDAGKYSVNADKVQAMEDARKNFGHKIFFVVQIGNLGSSVNFRNRKDAAWIF